MKQLRGLPESSFILLELRVKLKLKLKQNIFAFNDKTFFGCVVTNDKLY